MGTQLPQLAQPFPNFRPMSVMAELLGGSRCYLVHRYSSWPKGHYASWGPAAPQKGGGTQQPSTFWPRYCIQTAGWMKMPLGVEVGLGPDHIVLGGDPAPPFPRQKQDTPNFSRMSVVDKRLYGSTRHNTVFTVLVVWSSGRASVFGRCPFVVLRSTCS